jgi:membrane-associated phospholipid phosphatase
VSGVSVASAYRLKAHDLVWAPLSLLFAACSLAWPFTGSPSGGAPFPRGYLIAAAFLAIAAFSLLAPRLEAFASRRAAEGGGREDRLGALAAFVRIYYPQAFFALFFSEAILLSSQVLGGISHDDLFEAADLAIFGFQPAREFSRSLGSPPLLNEIMFGAYFFYFAFMVYSVWIPFFRGDRAEGERQVFAIVATMAPVLVWYLLFRVQGPKYWLPDLRESWYDGIKGGLFVRLFQHSLAKATLSGAAFPSTHVILTLTTLAFAYRNDRRFFALYVPVAVLILCSTVYIYAHWAVDILGGALIAAALPPLFYRLYPKADALAARLSLIGSRSRPR